MPSGVYERKPSKKRDEAIAKNFAKGHLPEVRVKATQSIIETWTEEKRAECAKRTREIMHKPDVREKHLSALAVSSPRIPSPGANGQPLTKVVILTAALLEPLGFIREYPVRTKGQTTTHKVPTVYKVDFGHPEEKISLELDGPVHNITEQKALDLKKDEVLQSLGWKVIRIKHRKEVLWPKLSAEIMQQLEAFS